MNNFEVNFEVLFLEKNYLKTLNIEFTNFKIECLFGDALKEEKERIDLTNV